MRDYFEMLRFVMVPVTVAALVLAGIIFAANGVDQYRCNNYQEITGKNVKFLPFDACYIETEAGWQKWDEYKTRAAASEGLKGVHK